MSLMVHITAGESGATVIVMDGEEELRRTRMGPEGRLSVPLEAGHVLTEEGPCEIHIAADDDGAVTIVMEGDEEVTLAETGPVGVATFTVLTGQTITVSNPQ